MHTPNLIASRLALLRYTLALAIIHTAINITYAQARHHKNQYPALTNQGEPPSPPRESAENARHLWIEAEDFTFIGGWQRTEKNNVLMGHTTGKNSKVEDKNITASTKLKIEAAGNYKVWVRAKGGKDDRVSREFNVSINSIVSPEKLGAHGKDGWLWQSAGVFPLEKGETTIGLIDTSMYYARCDKLLLTTDLNYIPEGPGGNQNVNQSEQRNEHPALYVRAIFNDLRPGPLVGQRGGEGFKADSTWSVQGSVNVFDGDLSLPDSGERAFIRSQNGTPFLIGPGGEKPSQAIRKLAFPMKGQVWFSFLVKPRHKSGTAGIRLLQESVSAHGFEIVSSGSDLVIKNVDSSVSKTSKDVFPLGRTALVLGRMDVDPDQAGNRSISVWINPNIDNLGTPLLKETLPAEIKGITHLAFIMSGAMAGPSRPMLDEAILSNYPYPAGFYHVAPRKRHFGKWHIPVKASEKKTQLPPPGYKLVFSDEFNSGELDQNKWNYRLGDKADSAQEAENVEVRDGNLLVHAKKQRVGKYDYTGGGVVSKPVFVYGYYEARFKIPAGEGWHTAFWTMPVYEPMEVRNTEIDFCEQDSGDPHYFSLGLINHREKGWNDSNIGRWVIEDAPNMVDEFVVIAADFTPEYIRFYMNGRLAKEVDSRLFPHGPATVQLSCIATKKKGDRFQDDARLPSQATFDYVRVYQHPKHAQAEASAKAKAVLPTKPLPPLVERQRSGAATGTLD